MEEQLTDPNRTPRSFLRTAFLSITILFAAYLLSPIPAGWIMSHGFGIWPGGNYLAFYAPVVAVHQRVAVVKSFYDFQAQLLGTMNWLDARSRYRTHGGVI